MSTQTHRHKATPNISVIDPRGLQIRSVAYHRTTSVQTPEPRITRHSFDAAVRLETDWDPRQFDAQNEPNTLRKSSLSAQVVLIESVDAGWRLSLNGHAGQLLSQWDGQGNLLQFEYDNLMRPITTTELTDKTAPKITERMTYADNRAEYISHNQCGQLITHFDQAGVVHINEYGLLGSTLSQSRRFITDSTPPTWAVHNKISYNNFEPESFNTYHSFDATGNILTQTDAKCLQQKFSYNIAGQVKKLTIKSKILPEKTLLREVLYSATGQIESETFGNNIKTIRRFENDRLLQLISSRSDRIFQNYNYTYDPIGNITSILDSSQPTIHFKNQATIPLNTYEYDTLYQLIETTGRESIPASQGHELPELQSPTIDPQRMGTYKQIFSYDKSGNLQTLTHQGHHCYTKTMLTDSFSNRSVPDTGESDLDPSKYFDKNGNLLNALPGSQTMRWNAKNQLTETIHISRKNTTNDNELYFYDSKEQRAIKIRTSKTKSGETQSKTFYLPGLEIQQSIPDEELHISTIEINNNTIRILNWNKPPDEIQNNQIRHILNDPFSFNSIEVNEQAELLSQEGYYPFGGTAWWAAKNKTEAKYKTIRYAGKERDSTGLYYYGRRYYAHWMMRWASPDPAGAVDGINLYRFVRNNPICRTDINGLDSKAKQRWSLAYTTIINTIKQQSGTIPRSVLKHKRPMYYAEQTRGIHYLNADERQFASTLPIEGRIQTDESKATYSNAKTWLSNQYGYVLGLNHSKQNAQDPERRERVLVLFPHTWGSFFHSTPFAGEPVLDAGMITLAQGKPVFLLNKTGHYRANLEQKMHTLRYLEENGADLQNTFVGNSELVTPKADIIEHVSLTGNLGKYTSLMSSSVYNAADFMEFYTNHQASHLVEPPSLADTLPALATERDLISATHREWSAQSNFQDRRSRSTNSPGFFSPTNFYKRLP